MGYFVYIIQSKADQSFYIGSTVNTEARINFHNKGLQRYTKAKRPWELVCKEEFQTKKEALLREKTIKRKKSKKYIEWLIEEKSHKNNKSNTNNVIAG